MSEPTHNGLDALTASFLAHKRAEFGLLAGAAAPDFTALAVAAHRLRGAGGAYGLDDLSEAGAALEEAARRHDAAAATSVLDRINELLASLTGDASG